MQYSQRKFGSWQIPVCSSEHELTPEIAVRSDLCHSKRTSRLRTSLFQSRFNRIGSSRSFIRIAYMTTRADRKGSCILIRTRYIQPPVRERKNGKWTFGVPTSTDLHLKPNNAFGTIHGHIQYSQRKFDSQPSLQKY